MIKTLCKKAYKVFEHTYLHVLFHAGAYSHIAHYGEVVSTISTALSAAVIAYNALDVIFQNTDG